MLALLAVVNYSTLTRGETAQRFYSLDGVAFIGHKTMRKSSQVASLDRSQAKLWAQVNRLVDELLETDADDTDVEFEFNERMDALEEDDELEDFMEEEVRYQNKAERDIDQADRQGDFDPIEFPDDEPFNDLLHKTRLVELLQEFKSAATKRDIALAQEAFAAICAHSDEAPHLLKSEIRDEVESTLGDLDLVVPRLVYTRVLDDAHGHERELLLEISSSLAYQVARNPNLLYQLSPREFEEFIAELFASFGYQVQLTARTRDGGRDLVAVRSEHGLLSKLLVECKRFARDRPVGISYVRELYAVKTLERATKAILATTSTFSRDARTLERQLIYELELKDFGAVTEWAREYSAALSSLRRK